MQASAFSTLYHLVENPQQWQDKIQSSLQKLLKYTPFLLCRRIRYV